MLRPPPRSTRTDTLFPYTTLFRSCGTACCTQAGHSIWNACTNTTRPRRDCSDGAPSALNQRDTVHAGAIGGDASAIAGPVADRVMRLLPQVPASYGRSEERRVGEECVRRGRTRG